MTKFEEMHTGNGTLVEKSQPYLDEEKHQANGKPVANGKAKDSAKQQANGRCDVPRKSINTYSWQEIRRHNQEADQWLVINRKVYDVTGWAERHPGGRRVLHHYAGEDATVRNSKPHPLSLFQLLGSWELGSLPQSISSTCSSSTVTYLLPNQFFRIPIQQEFGSKLSLKV